MTDSSKNSPTTSATNGIATIAASIECTGSNEQCKNVMRLIAGKIDSLQGQVDGHAARLDKGDDALHSLKELLETVKDIEKTQTILVTRFAIVWAGLGAIGTVALGAVIASLVALMSRP